jgi:predicted transcriptional regulator
MGNIGRSSESEKLLTGLELELMSVIWGLEKATVKEVVREISEKRPLAYTTVATVMKVLEQKGFLSCLKDSYAHVYRPVISKPHYESKCLEHVVSHVFDGEPMALVQRLISDRKLSMADREAIERTLLILADHEGSPP